MGERHNRETMKYDSRCYKHTENGARVITEGLFTSIHDSLVQDLASSTQVTNRLSVQKKPSELQSNPMLRSEKILKEMDKGEVSGERQHRYIFLIVVVNHILLMCFELLFVLILFILLQ